jgi:monoamine oxidase
MLDARIPTGPLEEKWSRYRSTARLVSPANRKKFQIVVAGTGLAGSSLAASLGEMGYAVVCLSFHDTAGKIEARKRVLRMVAQTDQERFGHCSNTEAWQVECPQEISVLHIARMNWEYNRALLS